MVGRNAGVSGSGEGSDEGRGKRRVLSSWMHGLGSRVLSPMPQAPPSHTPRLQASQHALDAHLALTPRPKHLRLSAQAYIAQAHIA